MPYTLGFVDDVEWVEHFLNHGADFGAATKDDYLRMADEFLGGPLGADTLECFRQRHDGTQGDRIRFNRDTEAFGVLSRDNVIRTYYVPDPLEHKEPDNMTYFRKECNKVKG